MKWFSVIAAGLATWFILTRRNQAELELEGAGSWSSSAGVWFDPWTPDPAYLPSPDPLADSMPDQLASVTEAAIASVTEAAASVPEALGLAAAPPPDQAARNVAAFLDMIAYAEGTAGPNGYRTLFGGGLFDSYADHPRQFFTFTDKAGKTNRTSAAGRYQFLARTWDALARKLQLPDISPPNQDAAAIELIRERGALRLVQAGRFDEAVAKVAPIWASLPGANYNQPERKLAALQAAYQRAGGTFEA